MANADFDITRADNLYLDNAISLNAPGIGKSEVVNEFIYRIDRQTGVKFIKKR